MTGKSVLIVEDNVLIAMGLEATLQDLGLSVCGVAVTAADAVTLFTARRPHLVVMDLRLIGDGDGVDAALAINAMASVPILFMTGSRDRQSVERIHQDHPAGILFKPVTTDALAGELLRIFRLA
ncbi:response regulator [Novispirillum sp. DQ9]|uniref:response regulator n=1 Tax=Novispirillum sp. DQ9 TaxID=3398612 RepID=UPI003C7CFAB4